jgi:hypothetical protein
MRKIIGTLVDSEDKNFRGMKWEEILRISPDMPRPRKAMDDLIALRYVVSSTEVGNEETAGDVRITDLSEVYGTSFFGRKWLIEQEKSD